MSYSEVANILEKLKQENEKLFKKLIFANNCLKFSIDFILFVNTVFNKIENYLEDNDVTKYREFVFRYVTIMKGKNILA